MLQKMIWVVLLASSAMVQAASFKPQDLHGKWVCEVSDFELGGIKMTDVRHHYQFHADGRLNALAHETMNTAAYKIQLQYDIKQGEWSLSEHDNSLNLVMRELTVSSAKSESFTHATPEQKQEITSFIKMLMHDGVMNIKPTQQPEYDKYLIDNLNAKQLNMRHHKIHGASFNCSRE